MLSDNQEEKHKDRWIEDKNEISQKFLEIFEEMKESSNVWKKSHIAHLCFLSISGCRLRTEVN